MAEDLSTYDAFGKLMDDAGNLVYALTPTTGGATGTYEINEVIPDSVAPGWYRFVGGLIDSAGREEVRYSGRVYLRQGRFIYLTEEADLGQGAYTIYGWPVALKYGDKIYIGAIESDGTKGQIVRSYDVVALAAAVAVLRTSNTDDDHNNPFLVVRPDQSQLVASVADHADGSSNNIDFFRSTGLAVSTFPAIGTPTFTQAGTAPTYGYPFINPADLDQLDTIVRYGASAELDWKLLRSENMNASPPTLTSYNLFINHYIKVVMSSDGTGLWIVPTNEPIGQTNSPTSTRPVFCPRLTLWHLDWATNVISSGGVAEGDLGGTFTQINGQSVNTLAYTNNFSPSGTWQRDSGGKVSLGTSALENRWGATSVAIQKLSDTATTGNHRIFQSVNCVAGTTYEFSGYFRAGGVTPGDEIYKVLINGPVGSMASHPTDATDPQLWVDLTDGTRFNATNNLDHWEITDVGNNWYRIGIVFTATNTVVGSYGFIFLLDAAGASSYLGTGLGLYLDSIQYAETPYTDRLMPFCQNITTVKKSTLAPPLVVYDPPGEKMIRLMAVKDVGDYVAFLFGEFDDYTGAKASDATRNVAIKYCEVTKSNWAVSTPVTIANDAVDGSDDDVTNGSFTYLGGDIIDRRKVVFDQQNVDGGGVSRIVYAWSPNGNFFAKKTLAESTTESLMRPISVPEVTFTGSALRHVPSDWIVWMQGVYDGYKPSTGGFDTDIHLALLTGGD